jgi:hypothetical protein
MLYEFRNTVAITQRRKLLANHIAQLGQRAPLDNRLILKQGNTLEFRFESLVHKTRNHRFSTFICGVNRKDKPRVIGCRKPGFAYFLGTRSKVTQYPLRCKCVELGLLWNSESPAVSHVFMEHDYAGFR